MSFRQEVFEDLFTVLAQLSWLHFAARPLMLHRRALVHQCFLGVFQNANMDDQMFTALD